MKLIEEIGYYGWKVNGFLKKFEENDVYLRRAVAVDVLQKLTWYLVKCKRTATKLRAQDGGTFFAAWSVHVVCGDGDAY